MNRTMRGGVLMLICLCLSACRTAPAPAARPLLAPLSNCVEVRGEPSTFPPGTYTLGSPEREWVDATRGIPGGFADARGDAADRRLVLRLVDTTKAAQAKAALVELVRTRPEVVIVGISAAEIAGARVAPAQWTLAELYDWMRYTTTLLGEWGNQLPPGRRQPSALGIRPAANRLDLGFNSDEQRQSFDAFIAGRGLPCDLFIIERITGPVIL